MKSEPAASPATRVVHAAAGGPDARRAVAPPLYLSTTFERDEAYAFPGGFDYAREANPNRTMLEDALAQLEGGVEAAAFASGMAAATTLFQALQPGDRVVVAHDTYYGVRAMLNEVFVPWGLRVDFVDASDVGALAAALARPARLAFVETPSNPMLRVTDLAAAAQLAHEAGALLVCDNTMATPIFQQPLALGADIVVHATTKYLAGNHDAMGGALVTAGTGAFWDAIRRRQTLCGAIPSPFASWLTLRGISTLVPRMERHEATALAVASALANDARVAGVLHPGLPSHPAHALAARQSSGTGGVFSIRVAGGRDAALGVASRLRLFRRATSFGGAESLVEHRATVEGPESPTPPDLLRLAIGLEAADDLIGDLDRALGTGSARS